MDYEEYSQLYREAWSDPLLRWLFSTVSVGMIWDDHDMGDDWNISRSWVEEMEEQDWWHQPRRAGFISYWIHQHVGNLSADELDENELWRSVRDGGEVTDAFDDFAGPASTTGGRRPLEPRPGLRPHPPGGHRDPGRPGDGGGPAPDGRRRLVGLADRTDTGRRGPPRAGHHRSRTSCMPSLHDLEAWSEQVCDGAWGTWFVRQGEKLRRDLDFDHWASFG